MDKDKIVFDIETKNTFADVGGQKNIAKLDTSFIGAYSYNQDKYLSFHEKVRKAYQKLAKEQPNRIILVDASLPAHSVIDQCWQAIEKRLLVRT